MADSLIICLAVSVIPVVPFVPVTTWRGQLISPDCVQKPVWLSSMSVCLTVFFGRQLVTVFACLLRDWFLKGNLLIIIVSVLIILPLALMRHLGKRLPALVICMMELKKGSQIQRISIFKGCGIPGESLFCVGFNR